MSASDDELQKVFEHVDANSEVFIARVMDYVSHPSISAHDIGIREVADLLVDMLKGLGMEAETVATKNHPMVLARRDVSPDKPTILLYGHYDVQPPDPLELWDSPPFEPTIRNGRIYARGIGDNKGQHFAQIPHHAACGEEEPLRKIAAALQLVDRRVRQRDDLT